MNRLALAASFLVFLFVGVTNAQSITRRNPPPVPDDGRRAIEQLKRLDQKVIVYRSLGDFEDGHRLALVPLATFEKELREVTGEVNAILTRMPASQLKTQITNALASYRDGAFWWRQIDQPRVVDVSALRYAESPPVVKVLASSIPYTVVINWRQAGRYLAQAERTAYQ